MFNNSANIDASHSTFSEVHRDQHVYSRTHVQGNQTVSTIVHGNQIFQGSTGLESLLRASVPSAAFNSIDRHPAPACLPGTRLELLARLADWFDSPNSAQPICWLSGLAGSGKSAVAQSIAEQYANQKRLAASFFFSRKEISRRRAQGLFPTLAFQILAFAPAIRPALVDALNSDATIPTKVLVEQMRRLLQQPIVSAAVSFPNPVLIVIDSLDECDDAKVANEVVFLLDSLVRNCNWPLRVLFTSRPEPHVIQAFQYAELRQRTCLLRLQDFSVDDDIRAYLRHSFESMRLSMITIPDDDSLSWPAKEEIDAIVQKAAGLFIFATTVVKFVGDEYSSPVVRLQTVLRMLRDGASSTGPSVHSDLDTLYLDALRTIPEVGGVRLVFGTIVFALSPLSARGLHDLLWKFHYDTVFVIKSLSSVLVTSDNGPDDGAVRIYHTSFRDFLTAPHRSRQYYVDPVTYHTILAQACLELMIHNLTADICKLGDPSTLNSEIENLDERCRLHIKEGVRYACRWFSHHLSKVPWDQKVNDTLVLSVQGFAHGYLLNWIEVLSLIGELESAMFILREAADWLKCSQKLHQETLSLLQDAERLVLMYFDPIQQAALQVYYSIPSMPTHVQLRKTYQHELKDKFVVTYGLEDIWNPCLRSVSTGATITSLAISASGHLIASAGGTPGVQMWDALTGKNLGHLIGTGTSSCPVIFSPLGDYVAIGNQGGIINVWDVATGQQLLDPNQNPHRGAATVLAFSQNSILVASGSTDATVRVWDMVTKTLKHSLEHHQGPIRCLLFSFSDGLIASGSDDSSVTTSEVSSGRLIRRMRGHSSKVNTIAFSPDGRSIASGSDDLSIRLWDTRSAVCLRTYTGSHKKPICRVWITADNKYVVSVCNTDIFMWEIGTRKSPRHIWSFDHYFRKAATLFPAWYAKLARLIPAKLVSRIAEMDDAICVAFSPDGKALGCACDGSIFYLELLESPKVWSRLRRPLTTSSTLEEPPLFYHGSDSGFTAIAMTLDQAQLVTSFDDGRIDIWNTAPPRRGWKDVQLSLGGTIEGFWPSPDGRSVLTKQIVGLQLVTIDGSLIKEPATGGDALSKAGGVPSPDSKYFAYWAEYAWNVDQSYSIYIYDAGNGSRLKRIPGFFNITCGRFTAHSELFACAHGEGTVQVWELPSVLCKTTIETGHGSITALEFIPGNSALVVGSDKGCVEMRTVEDGEVILRVDYTASKVLALAVPQEALFVVVGHEDGSLFLWDPTHIDVPPHCLSPKDTSDDAEDQKGIDFIKFTDGYRSISTRSLRGVVSTWDLSHCLAKYAERGGETLPATADGDTSSVDSTSSLNPAITENSDSTTLNEPTELGAKRDAAHATQATSDLPQLQPTASEPTAFESTTLTEPTTPGSTSPIATASCPHLLSRSDSNIVYDRYFRSAYSVDCRQGWVSDGPRRIFWLPADLRPDSPIALSAFNAKLVIMARSKGILFYDLKPLVNATTVRPIPGGGLK